MAKLTNIKDKKLLETALTHRSFLNESKEKVQSNERLEFLGDSVLSLIVSDYLFIKYPQYNEGILTNLRAQLVNTGMLATCAKECNMGSLLRLSKGEEEGGGRENQSILADLFEAYLGALYLDGELLEVKKFVKKTVIIKADEFIKNNLLKDPKSRLQEYTQANKHGSPKYQVLDERGPAHKKEFTIGVFIEDKLLAKGDGKSKQKAEEQAAEKALKSIKA